MAKNKKHAGDATEPAKTVKMKRREYEREMAKLHGELVALQEWVKATGAQRQVHEQQRQPEDDERLSSRL